MTKINLRSFKGRGLLLIAVLLLTLSTSIAQEAGGRLFIGRTADINNPDARDLSSQNLLMVNQVYDTLIRLAPDGEALPQLAESFVWNDDKTQLTLNLRQNVTFHDGSVFDAQDVVYTIERNQDPERGNPQVIRFMVWVTAIEVVDDFTIVLTFDDSRPTFLDGLERMFIVDEATVEGPDAASVANGTGPFVFSEWTPGSSLILTRNENYWDAERPLLDAIEIQVFGDQQALAIALEAGAIDMAEDLDNRDVSRLIETDNFNATRHTGNVYYFTYNVANAPSDDVRFRQAISYAIDRQRIVDEVLAGIGEPLSWPWPSNSPGFNAEKNENYAYNLDTARALLAEIGIEEAEIEIISNAVLPDLLDINQIIQADLAQIGINASIVNLEFPQWRERSFAEGGWDDILSGNYGSVSLSPITLLTSARPFIPTTNTAGFRDDTYSDLADQALTEPDDAVRIDLVEQLGDIIQTELFVTPIASRDSTLTFVSTIEGVDWRQGQGPYLRDTYFNN